MSFCLTCGQKLTTGSKFCSSCGESVINTTAKRKTVYKGKVYKCPNCGEILSSFIAICPACGYEISSAEISNNFSDFINRLNRCEKNIAESQSLIKSQKTGSDIAKKIFWIIINIVAFGIPLLVRFAINLMLIGTTPKLSKEEKEMTSLIENYMLPNNRESILEVLMFSKEKIDFLSKERIDRKSAYWVRLWSSKAEQLKQKADLFFPEDSIVERSYREILDDISRVTKVVKIKIISGILFFILIIGFIFFLANTEPSGYSSTFVWPSSTISDCLPEPEVLNGKININTEKSFNFYLYNIEADDFEKYIAECKEKGFTENITKTDLLFNSSNKNGYNLNMFYDKNEKVLNINLINTV